nr:MAG: hypothetical protein J07AB56_14250 [Candidatus Nanosalinarum sp. J07AB56]
MRKPLTVLAILVSATSSIAAVSVGVAPGDQNLGTVERGESIQSAIYLSVSGEDERFIVEPEVQDASSTRLVELGDADFVNYSSEESTPEKWNSWVDFNESRQVVDPSTTVRAGGRSFEGIIPFTIDVPRDAEPGWHAGSIPINPRFASEGTSGSVSIQALVDPIVLFRVPGDVRREFEVTETRGARTATNEGLALVTIRNTGTVSSSLGGFSLNIVSPAGGTTQTRRTNGEVLEPGETHTFTGAWSQEQLPAGNYEAQVFVNHMSGGFAISESLQITDFIQENVDVEAPEDNRTGSLGQPGSDATWIILLVLVVLAVVLYSFDLDPIWIIAISSVVGLLFLALTGALPIWVPLIAGAAGVGVLYLL